LGKEGEGRKKNRPRLRFPSPREDVQMEEKGMWRMNTFRMRRGGKRGIESSKVSIRGLAKRRGDDGKGKVRQLWENARADRERGGKERRSVISTVY